MKAKAISPGEAGFRNHSHSEKWEARKEGKKGGRQRGEANNT